jgi:lysyl-tRNA synthetase class 2
MATGLADRDQQPAGQACGGLQPDLGAARRRRPSSAPRWIGWVTLLFASVLLAAVASGPWLDVMGDVQAALVPGTSARGVVHGLLVSISVGLLLVSRGLMRRQRRAWRIATALCAAAAVLLLLHDIDVPTAFAAVALVVALVHRREEFYAVMLAPGRTRALGAAILAFAVIFVYGTTASLWYASTTGHTTSLLSAMGQAAWGMVGQDAAAVPDDFSQALVASLVVASVLTLLGLVGALLRPPRGDITSSRRDWDEARRIVTDAGADSLAYFALRRDKSYFFDESNTAFLAYRELAGIALVPGDPIGDPARFPRLLEQFVHFAHHRAWRVAVLGVHQKMREAWEAVGLATLYVGDEAIVDTASFSLEGRSVRKLRQSVHRLRRLGYTVEMSRADRLDEATRAEIARVSEIWRGGQPERGFSMALDDVQSTELHDTLFVLGYDGEGRLAGFLHFVPVPATGDLSLSAMRRLPETPNGFNEFLISSLLFWAQERSIAHVSLNFAVFGALLREQEAGPAARLAARAVRLGDRFFQLERLLAFNGKFLPDWCPRYIAVESRVDLPEVALVVLRLENLLARGRASDAGASAGAAPRGAGGGAEATR